MEPAVRLRRARRQATGLLFVVAAALVVVAVFLDDDGGWVGYLTAGLEAAMVGGLADWFAVTAVFRHPLGLPIPHTAVIPERKDAFGETLGGFVQDQLLTSEAIVDRVGAARPAERSAAWLAQPDNAARIAGHIVDASVTVADLLRDEDVHRVIDEVVRTRIDATPLAPLAGRLLDLLTDDARHQEVLDALLHGLDDFLRDNRESLHDRFATQAPWWLPGAVEDRVFDRLLDGVHEVIHDVAKNPNHELRRDFDARVRRFAHDLQTSPELRARGEAVKQDLLNQPALRQWTGTVWDELKATLRSQADDPESSLRRQLAGAIAAFGARLQDDPVLAARVDETVVAVARSASEHFHDEIAGMVSGTVAHWDGNEAAGHLELLLGPDLQFIRINGTVVGGCAGLAIHGILQLLG